MHANGTLTNWYVVHANESIAIVGVLMAAYVMEVAEDTLDSRFELLVQTEKIEKEWSLGMYPKTPWILCMKEPFAIITKRFLVN